MRRNVAIGLVVLIALVTAVAAISAGKTPTQLYDLLIGAVIFAVVWPLRHRTRHPTELMWLVVALLGAGRFVEFFARSDSDTVALGLSSAQWTSLAIVLIGLTGLIAARRRPVKVHERPGGQGPSPQLAGDRG